MNSMKPPFFLARHLLTLFIHDQKAVQPSLFILYGCLLPFIHTPTSCCCLVKPPTRCILKSRVAMIYYPWCSGVDPAYVFKDRETDLRIYIRSRLVRENLVVCYAVQHGVLACRYGGESHC